MHHRPLSLLLVEDNDDHAELMTASAEQAPLPCNVTRFSSAEAVLDHLFGSADSADSTPVAPDIVLMDLHLPGMDGLTCLRTLKERPQTKAIPVVVLSSSERPEEIESAYEAGASSFVVKPLTTDDFVIKLAELNMYWSLTAALPVGREEVDSPIPSN